MTAPLAAHEAAVRILAAIAPQPPLRVPLDSALGSVLAEPVSSPIDIPFRANSAMDGYAVRADDVRGASPTTPRVLAVIDRTPAGQFPAVAIGPGQAARIFTGAPVPEGADTVIRQEDTDQGHDQVRIHDDRDAGVNIRRAGEDIRAGTLVFAAGTVLGPAHLGVLASLAVAHPVVHRRPRVGILASGDEIVGLDQPDLILSGQRIASSNSHTLTALVREAGGEPVDLGIAADTPASVRSRLEGATDCDLLITSAGVSVGEHDHLRSVIESMGGRLDFWRVRIRPGAPVGAGSLGPVPWIGLPGNPVSTMVTFQLFARPAIRKLMGHRLPFRAAVPVVTTESIRVGPRLQHFLRATLGPDGPPYPATLTGGQGSGILTSMARADALVIVPEGHNDIPAGTQLQAIRLDEPRHLADPSY